ncbi:tetratricopeptide repeat protein [Candidatus Woesearchaeota archaeon]|nr:tetratricopeptide repeat protein [Candidatus Woesearchaeota archaeon]
MRDMTQQEEYFQKAVKLISESLHQEGERKEQSYHQAIQFLTQSIKLNPQDTRAYIYRGLVYNLLDESLNGIQDYLKVIEMEPNNAEAHIGLSHIYHKGGFYEDAIKFLNKAIVIDPKNTKAHLLRGDCHYIRSKSKKTNELNKAIEDFTSVLELNPTEDQAYFARGVAHAIKNETDDSFFPKAIDDLSKAIELNPTNSEAYYWRGKCYLSRRKIEENLQNGMNDLNKANKLNPHHIDTLILASQVLNKIGAHEKAFEKIKAYFKITEEQFKKLPNDINKIRQKIYSCLESGEIILKEHEMDKNEENLIEDAIIYFNESIRLLDLLKKTHKTFSKYNKSNDNIKEDAAIKEITVLLGRAYCGRGVAHTMARRIRTGLKDLEKAANLKDEIAIELIKESSQDHK